MVQAMTKVGRNDPCPCGSGKKYKHCCERNALAQPAPARANTAFIPGALQTAIAHHQNGRLSQAKALYQQILQAEPAHPDALQLLGLIKHEEGDSPAAMQLIQQAIQARPSDAVFHFNLGKIQQDLGQLDGAVWCYRQALLRQPDFFDALLALGNTLRTLWQCHEAVEQFQQALVLRPNDPDAYCNMAITLVIQGRPEEAVAVYRKLLALHPESDNVFSSLLFAMQNLRTCPPAELFSEHLRYAERFEAPLKPFWKPHPNNRDPERRLKVGYVSGDFYSHVVANFFEPILANHNKIEFEIYGYYNNDNKHDNHTDWIAAHVDHWLVCNTLSDDQLAAHIRADGIDILVDLSGHTAYNRMPVFARKPAPVQASYIGYPGTTGLSAIDYRISDPWQDPVGLTERYHSETLVRIPGGMAFAPDPTSPAVNALPALTSGELILACLNNLSKLNPAVVNLWARILRALPQARLMLGNVADNGIKAWLHGLFDQAGIGPERLILQPRVQINDYLTLHHTIDLALDPFPYNGGTTTMHSLWMGVPVITLAGSHAVSRLCTAHLSRVGLEEFIAHSEDEYLQCAVKFANDLPALNAVRQSLRARMNAPECQPATITRHLEAAYRDMWRAWCNS